MMISTTSITYSTSKVVRQWLSLVGIIWLQSINGTNLNFPAYSSQLKQLLSMSQIQLNNLAFASDAGKIFGFLSGIASLYLPLWLVLIIGSTLGLVGYGIQYLVLTNYITSLSYYHIFLLTLLAGNSICWINTVCYVVAIKNFPFDRQVAVGLSTSYQGLSAKLYTVLVDAFFPNKKAKAYLLFNSLLPIFVGAFSAPLVRDIGSGSFGNGKKNMRSGFLVIFFITIATGVYSIVTSLGSITRGLSRLGNMIGVVMFLSAILVVPLGVKIKEVVVEKEWWLNREVKIYNFTTEEGGNNNNNAERVESGLKEEEEEEEEMEEMGNEEMGVKEEIGVKEMVKRVNFWLYFMVYLFGATLGLVYLNNLGQIAESRGCSATSSLVSLSSSFGFFGRLIPSLVDYFFSRSKYLISRPASIATLMAPLGGAFFLLLSTSNVSLYISTAIIGVCTGAITSISVSTTTELFGTKNFSVNHNVVVANIPVGSFVFGYLAAFLYRKEGNSDEGKCMGMNCYRTTFIIWGSLCFFGTFLALILYARMRKLYPQQKS